MFISPVLFDSVLASESAAGLNKLIACAVSPTNVSNVVEAVYVISPLVVSGGYETNQHNAQKYRKINLNLIKELWRLRARDIRFGASRMY